MTDIDDTELGAEAEHHPHTGTAVITALFLAMAVGMFAWAYWLLMVRG